MKKRIADINNRFNMAVAERNCYEKGSKQYEQLTEVVNFILREYERKDGRTLNVRHSFRLSGNDYRMVVLESE